MTAVDAWRARPRLFTAAVGVVAACWGLALVGMGGVRMYAEWSEYSWERSFFHSGVSFATFHLGFPVFAIEAALGLLWFLATPAWLVLVIVTAVGDRRRRAWACAAAVVLMALAAVVVIFWPVGIGDAVPGTPFDVHLVTPAFVRSLLVACLGVCGVATTGWMLVGRRASPPA